MILSTCTLTRKFNVEKSYEMKDFAKLTSALYFSFSIYFRYLVGLIKKYIFVSKQEPKIA